MSLSIPISILLYRDIWVSTYQLIYQSVYLSMYLCVYPSSQLSLCLENSKLAVLPIRIGIHIGVLLLVHRCVKIYAAHSTAASWEREDTYLTISSAFIFYYWHENIQINGYLIWKVSQICTHTHKAFHNDLNEQNNWNLPLLHAQTKCNSEYP